MEKQGWYERKIVRYLKNMVREELGLLEKVKEGIKGARAKYRTTSKAHEYEALSFFDRIREESQEKGWIGEENECMLIYGIPPKNKLLPLEKEILDQTTRSINEAFHDLVLLKRSIMARNERDQPLDYDLAINYLLKKAADMFGRQLLDEVYHAESNNEVETLIGFAKQREVEIAEPERFLEIEKKWLSLDAAKSSHRPWSSLEEACLAVLVMLSPDSIQEYSLDSYNYLKGIIGKMEKQELPLSDRSLVIIARDFLKREKRSGNPYVQKRILGLRKWPWLRLKIGNEATEKLVKILLYLWKKRKERATERKKEQKSEAKEPEIHVMTKEEESQEIEKIIKGSSKLRI